MKARNESTMPRTLVAMAWIATSQYSLMRSLGSGSVIPKEESTRPRMVS